MMFLKGIDSNGLVFWLTQRKTWTEDFAKAEPFNESELEQAFLDVIRRNRNLDREEQMEPSYSKGLSYE